MSRRAGRTIGGAAGWAAVCFLVAACPAPTESAPSTSAISPPASMPGGIVGTATLEAIAELPLGSPVAVMRQGTGRSQSIPVEDGTFRAVLRPGHYIVRAYAGSAPCPPVAVTVEIGQMTPVTLVCQGD